MRIHSVDTVHLRSTLERPFSFSQFSYFDREAVPVNVTAQDGRIGWGEAYGTAAVLHFYAARPRHPFALTSETRLIERGRTENPFRTEIVEAPIRLEAGRWHLPEAVSLGVAVVPEAFEPYLAGRFA